jgi:hypothetical protein
MPRARWTLFEGLAEGVSWQGGRARSMTPHRPSKDQMSRDRELDLWLEHAMGIKRADPEPVVHDLDD